MSWMSLSLQHELPEDAVCVCSNCDWEGPPAEVEDLKDPNQRLYPGETVPAGECPECDCAVYLKEEPPTVADMWEALIVATAGLLAVGTTQDDFDVAVANETNGKNRLGVR